MAGIEADRAALRKKDKKGDKRTKNAEENVKRLEVALAGKKESKLRSYKLTNKERFDLKGKVESSNQESTSPRPTPLFSRLSSRRRLRRSSPSPCR